MREAGWKRDIVWDELRMEGEGGREGSRFNLSASAIVALKS